MGNILTFTREVKDTKKRHPETETHLGSLKPRERSMPKVYSTILNASERSRG